MGDEGGGERGESGDGGAVEAAVDDILFRFDWERCYSAGHCVLCVRFAQLP